MRPNDHRYYVGAYLQDDWKVTPRLTLTLGLRWDFFTPYAETSGRQANLVLNGGGNGSTGTYYMPNQGCQTPRAAAFNTLLAASGIQLQCVSSLAVGQAQKGDSRRASGLRNACCPIWWCAEGTASPTAHWLT